MSKNLPVGTTHGNVIRFKREDFGRDPSEWETVDVSATMRDWDVTDPAARAEAFRSEVGEDVDDWWVKCAHWYINAEKNAAALCIFRFKTPANLEAWEAAG